MRIKKKYVLKEARITEGLLIDDLSSLNPKQRRVLKSLYKKYHKPNDPDFRWWNLSTHNITQDLYDKAMMPFNEAYNLANLFVRHGEELFKTNGIQTEYHPSHILSLYMDKFIRYYKETLVDEVLPDKTWLLNVGGEVGAHDAILWDSYNGLTLYMPYDREKIWELPSSERALLKEKLVLVKVIFNFDRDDLDNPTLSINYRLGDNKEITGTIVEKAIFEPPKEVTKKYMVEWVADIVNNQIKLIVEDFKFPAPKVVEPAEED